MNIVDILVLGALIMGFVRGYQIGLVRELGSALGFIGGVALSIPISNWLIGFTNDNVTKTLISTSVLITLSFGIMTAGEYAGMMLKLEILRGKILNRLDSTIGIFLATFTLILALWVGVALTSLLPSNNLQATIRQSKIFNLIDRHLPPASELLSTLNHLVDVNDSPLVFSGKEPSPDATLVLPSATTYQSMLERVSPSVVRIQGLGCGGLTTGSGFIYAPDRVVTNAHVVAGVKDPKVYDANGTHDVTVVSFDPSYDIAILSVHNLVGEPLSLDLDPAKKGSILLTDGYPGGGKQSPGVAAVLDTVNALGRDIYLREKTERNIYVLQSSLIPGDSGGPVLNEEGEVVGVVFGTSTTYNNVGYALTLNQLMTTLNESRTSNTPVSTGACSKI